VRLEGLVLVLRSAGLETLVAEVLILAVRVLPREVKVGDLERVLEGVLEAKMLHKFLGGGASLGAGLSITRSNGQIDAIIGSLGLGGVN